MRNKYGSSFLVWSQELADLAKTWALKLAERGRILYPELPGINIYLKKFDLKYFILTKIKIKIY